MTGLLAITAVAPNVIGAMGKLGLLPTKRQKGSIAVARDRLITKGLIEKRDEYLRLTAYGEKTLTKLKQIEQAIVRPRRWDKKVARTHI